MHRLIQLTLDLFDRPPVAAPAEPLDRVMVPAAFSHPRANRQASLGNSVVGYEFKRGKRRTIGFVVGPDGLVVSAPRWVPLYEVEAALREKSAWILSKLDEARQRGERMASARIEWKEGATLPFLGETVILVLDPRHAFEGVGAVLHSDGPSLPGVPRHALHIGLAHNAAPEQIRDAVQAWLMRQAKRVFTERLDHFAQRLDVQWHKLSLSNAGTRWGTAKADGSIRLNWRLIHFRQSVIDYVVAHELSHLRVMDHSPRFWDTVRTVVPDYAELRDQLKDELLPRW
ncbi:MAG: SprT family zinc-dependent metalloprotease [Burkholderiaceae bacterium]|nr:SprT family zinc-dependent metalloprotease [Burkholderiaceae bacterium]MDO9090742.1 SprT family zinc-dependent metalloprotease [Burkholderiaceae bacterium]MDP1967656.1 SprT family zinc-dependent metalloprotease [Burkholderiaceae bacterium]